MKGFLQYKGFVGGVKDVDVKNRIVTGYLSAFGNKDHDGDIVVKGAFARTIKARGPEGKNEIFFLNQHNWKQPHGKFAVLKEDSTGLYFESNTLPDTSYSSDALKLYEAGIIKEHSHGFNVIKSENDEKEDATLLTELKLYEGSNVTLGANSQTPFTGFKGLTIKDINEKSNAIIKMLRDGNLTDDGFLQLEIGLKQLQKEAYELGKSTLNPSLDTLDPLSIIKQFSNNLSIN
jgi:HK97 family phage prohead protease